jgi:hypothetical protein
MGPKPEWTHWTQDNAIPDIPAASFIELTEPCPFRRASELGPVEAELYIGADPNPESEE